MHFPNFKNNTCFHFLKQSEWTNTLHKKYSVQFFGKNPDFNKEDMRWCCCDSQHAAVAPEAISLSQPLSHSTGRGEQRRVSKLGKKIRASDSNLPCIILSLRSSHALRCQLHKHHFNWRRKSCNIGEATSCTSVAEKRYRETELSVRKKTQTMQKICRKSTQHAVYGVLAPPTFPTTKEKKGRRTKNKSVFLI